MESVRKIIFKRFFYIIFFDVVFRKIDGDMKIFILGFVRWIIEKKNGGGLYYVKILKSGKK